MLIVIMSAPRSSGFGPDAAGDHAACVGGVEQHRSTDLSAMATDLGDRMRIRLRLAPIVISLGRTGQCQLGQRVDVDCVPVAVDRALVDGQSVQPGGTGAVVGDVTADGGWRHDDRVAGGTSP